MAKARTAAAKRKIKRGRPRVETAAREPNGRISRSGIDHGPADIVALDARRRHLGLTKDQAKDQKAGTFIGYLNLIGYRDGISDGQYEAATQFLSLRDAYLRAIAAPGRIIDGDVGVSSDFISEAYEEWVSDTKVAYGECRKSILNAQGENRTANLFAALDLCLIQGQHMHHMVGDVRILCNALGKFFRVAR